MNTTTLESLSLGAFTLFFISWALLAIRRLLAGYKTARLGQQDEPWLPEVVLPKLYKPISILVPIHNQASRVRQSVHTFLQLDYPQFEVIVVNDGSSDETVGVLQEAFQLVRLPNTARTVLGSLNVRATYRSVLYPNLLVVDKDPGGRSDALNAAINHAHYPLILFADADTQLDSPSLVQGAAQFIKNDQLVALIGTCQLGSTAKEDTHGADPQLPPNLLQRFQIVEQARSLLFAPGRWNPKLVTSWGMFGLFSREEILNVEGLHGSGGAEFEMVLRLQQRTHDFGLPYQIRFDPHFFCWKQPPSTWRALLRERANWQQGVLQALWTYRKLFFRSKYGSLVWALQEAWFYQVAAPIFMSLGYLSLLSLTLLGRSEFLGVFLVFASLSGLLTSSLALYAQSVHARGFRQRSSLLVLWLDAFLEPIFYQPPLIFNRLGALLGTLQLRRSKQLRAVKN